MNTITTTVYAVSYYNLNDTKPLTMKSIRVNIREGYTTTDDIQRIIAIFKGVKETDIAVISYTAIRTITN